MCDAPAPLPPHPCTNPDASSTIAFARQVLDAEAQALRAVQPDGRFAAAVDALTGVVRRNGTVVVSGLGKSGLVGQKISATMASIGIPSHFLHPTEAVHGDLGRVRRNDAVLLLSFGGSTEEVVTLGELLRADGVLTLAITKSAGSALGKLVDHCLELGPLAEACPHNLAPTASTTATMAYGDALALATSRALAFSANDFQKFHPGGGLGRQMMPVAEAMRFRAGENLALASESMSVQDAYTQAKDLAQASGLRRPGALVVVDTHGRLCGIFTDGDLRRLVTEGRADLAAPIGSVCTRSPRTLTVEARVRDAVHAMREKRIDEIPVVDAQGRPAGLIDIQDLMTLKVVEG